MPNPLEEATHGYSLATPLALFEEAWGGKFSKLLDPVAGTNGSVRNLGTLFFPFPPHVYSSLLYERSATLPVDHFPIVKKAFEFNRGSKPVKDLRIEFAGEGLDTIVAIAPSNEDKRLTQQLQMRYMHSKDLKSLCYGTVFTALDTSALVRESGVFFTRGGIETITDYRVLDYPLGIIDQRTGSHRRVKAIFMREINRGENDPKITASVSEYATYDQKPLPDGVLSPDAGISGVNVLSFLPYRSDSKDEYFEDYVFPRLRIDPSLQAVLAANSVK